MHLLEFTVKHKEVSKGVKTKVNEINKPEMTYEAKLKRCKAILYSRPELEQQLKNKHGQLSDKALVAVLNKMFPDKFKI